MIDATDIAFVCYPVTDMARSREFYEGLLGLKVISETYTETGPWVDFACGQATLSLWQSDLLSPVGDGVVAALEVGDFDDAIRSLQNAGVEFLIDPIESETAHRAVIVDPDGSRLCIHKRKQEIA